MKRIFPAIPAIAFAALALGGCQTPTPILDEHFGAAVNAAKAEQVINPAPSANSASGIDGQAGHDAVGRYHDSFRAPPPTFTVINVGGAAAR